MCISEEFIFSPRPAGGKARWHRLLPPILSKIALADLRLSMGHPISHAWLRTCRYDRKIVNGKCCSGVPSLCSHMTMAHHMESVPHAIASLQRATLNMISESCSHDRVLDHGRAAPGIEAGTFRTRSENHTTRPSSRLDRVRPMKLLRINVYGITMEEFASGAGCNFCTPHG